MDLLEIVRRHHAEAKHMLDTFDQQMDPRQTYWYGCFGAEQALAGLLKELDATAPTRTASTV